jgi:hypothetical protein
MRNFKTRANVNSQIGRARAACFEIEQIGDLNSANAYSSQHSLDRDFERLNTSVYRQETEYNG